MQTDNRREITWFDTSTFYPLPENRFRHQDTGEDWTGVAYQNPGEACALKLAQDLYAYYRVNAQNNPYSKAKKNFSCSLLLCQKALNPSALLPFPLKLL